MPRFSREAILAAGCVEPPQIDPHAIGPLETWEQVGRELNKLTPRQRCHAIYADWLRQLNAEGGDAQIQIRDLLLGQGALAVSYLAEMAQNADDATASSLAVFIEGDWLLVANDGRPLSSLNLVGLCRFFIHSDGQIVGLTPETIGRFGIGFKSCHRVADEVFVWSWGGESEFGFRLPICHGGGEASKPHQETLQTIVDCLAGHGSPIVNLRPQDQLGHCTPEAIETIPQNLPETIRQRIRGFKIDHPDHGVWFALHLHDRGRQEAAQRINDQESTLYELSPLFLRNVRQVTLQDRTLEMTLGRRIGNRVGPTTAQRITLNIAEPGGEQARNDRLLMLSSTENPSWKIALPTDGEFRLKRPGVDPFSLRNGGGYAFLPLSALKWPWIAHLHLDAPTNLARSDWNPADALRVHSGLEDAAVQCAAWLAANVDRWHPEWQPAEIIAEDAERHQPGTSIRVFADALIQGLGESRTLRSLWGGQVAPNHAVGLKLEPGQMIRDAWVNLARILPQDLKDAYPLVLKNGGAAYLLQHDLNTQGAGTLFQGVRGTLENTPHPQWQDYLRIVLGTKAPMFGGVSRSELIENAIKDVPLNKSDGGVVSIKEAAELRFAVQLTPEWHEGFQKLSNWLESDWTLAGTQVFGFRVSQLLRLLSAPAEVPADWDAVIRMKQADFERVGNQFWTVHRPECPNALRNDAVSAIWVESGQNWVPLSEVWMADEPVAMLKNVVQPLGRRAQEVNNTRRNHIADRLQQWNLRDVYEEQVLATITARAEGEFTRRLTEENPPRQDRLALLVSAQNWLPDRLPAVWREPVMKAAKSAIAALFRRDRYHEQAGKSLLVGDGDLLSVLAWNPDNLKAPAWLNQAALRWCERNGLLRDFNLNAVDLTKLSQQQRAELGEAFLKNFHRWADQQANDQQLHALGQLFEHATGNWVIGLPGNVNRRINEYCDWIRPENRNRAFSELGCVLAGHDNLAFNGCDPLPEILGRISVIRQKAIPVSQFAYHGPDGDDLQQLADGEIPDAILNSQWFQRLREILPNAVLVSLCAKPSLRWKRGNMEIEVREAAFGLCNRVGAKAIFVVDATRPDPPPPDRRFLPVLVAYTQVAPEDTAVAQAVRAVHGLGKVYRENRSKILARLVQKHATEMGYEAEHVLRELLQNAESAYGTRRRELLPPRKTFSVRLASQEHGSKWKVVIQHQGRPFNEPDNHGQPCDTDIAKLVALAGLPNENPENVGRFNRGFKSVFNVTDAVHVVSGGYDFRVEDMLMLDPAVPEPADANDRAATTFEFITDAEHLPKLLRETAGQARPFRVEELVFLKHLDEVRITVDAQPPIVFEIERGNTAEGWRVVTLRERREPPARQGRARRNQTPMNERKFLVRHLADDRNGRCAVAVAVDADEQPEMVDRELRLFYRTFPLLQSSHWLNCLINADFATDMGRTGWRPDPRNEDFVMHGMRAYFDLLRAKIEASNGRIAPWFAWVKSLDRRRLAECAAIFSQRRHDFEKAIREMDTWLWQHLPNDNSLQPAAEFIFPSRLLRRLQENQEWLQTFALDSDEWISEDVAIALADFGEFPKNTLDLKACVARLIYEGRDKDGLKTTLEAIRNEEFARDALADGEIEAALGLVATHQVVEFKNLLEFVPDGYSPDLSFEIALQRITVSQLTDAWDETGALQQFTLAGWMGDLVFDGARCPSDERRCAVLKSPMTKIGKQCWHRLLCLGSLLGARALPQRINAFWKEELIPRNVFDNAAGTEQLTKVLDEISHRKFTDLDATGESAELWRRMFYDFQKMRVFVFDDELPDRFLQHLAESRDPQGPINFLKSGFQKDGERQAGVIGQSMTAPLFWLMRELRRIGVIETDTFDTTCFYMNGPARRVAARLETQWLEETDLRASRFEEVLRLSETCHARMTEECGDHSQFFDLPLQWYAFNNPR